jgi:hypothetical protein
MVSIIKNRITRKEEINKTTSRGKKKKREFE